MRRRGRGSARRCSPARRARRRCRVANGRFGLKAAVQPPTISSTWTAALNSAAKSYERSRGAHVRGRGVAVSAARRGVCALAQGCGCTERWGWPMVGRWRRRGSWRGIDRPSRALATSSLAFPHRLGAIANDRAAVTHSGGLVEYSAIGGTPVYSPWRFDDGHLARLPLQRWVQWSPQAASTSTPRGAHSPCSAAPLGRPSSRTARRATSHWNEKATHATFAAAIGTNASPFASPASIT